VEEAPAVRRERLATEGAELDAAEKALRAEQADLNQSIARFNTQNLELERALKEHKAGCPVGSEDAALIEACNARALEFNAAAQRHEAQRPLLETRQRELPARIQAQNTARRNGRSARANRNPSYASRTDASTGSTRAFIFGRHSSHCCARPARRLRSAGTLGDLAVPPAMAAVERAHACLKAVTSIGGCREDNALKTRLKTCSRLWLRRNTDGEFAPNSRCASGLAWREEVFKSHLQALSGTDSDPRAAELMRAISILPSYAARMSRTSARPIPWPGCDSSARRRSRRAAQHQR
jgi:hypothetical protein